MCWDNCAASRRLPALDFLQKRRPRLRLAQFRHARQLFAPLLRQFRGFLAQPLRSPPVCLPVPPFAARRLFSSRTRFSNWRLTSASRSFRRCFGFASAASAPLHWPPDARRARWTPPRAARLSNMRGLLPRPPPPEAAFPVAPDPNAQQNAYQENHRAGENIINRIVMTNRSRSRNLQPSCWRQYTVHSHVVRLGRNLARPSARQTRRRIASRDAWASRRS